MIISPEKTYRDELYYDGTLDQVSTTLVINGTDVAEATVSTDTSTSGIIKVSVEPDQFSDGDLIWVRIIPTIDEVDQKPIKTEPATITSLLSNVDGLSLSSFNEALLAYIGGKTSVLDHGDGTYTIDHYKQDGTTSKIVINFDQDGQWTSTTIN